MATICLPFEVPCFLCGGALDDGADVRLRGFAICTTCAVELSFEERRDDVARARHRRALQQLGLRLLGEVDRDDE